MVKTLAWTAYYACVYHHKIELLDQDMQFKTRAASL